MSRDFGVRAAVVTAVKKYQRLASADQMKIQCADRDFRLRCHCFADDCARARVDQMTQSLPENAETRRAHARRVKSMQITRCRR